MSRGISGGNIRRIFGKTPQGICRGIFESAIGVNSGNIYKGIVERFFRISAESMPGGLFVGALGGNSKGTPG